MSTQASALETLAGVKQRLASARAQLEQLLTGGDAALGRDPSIGGSSSAADVVSALAVVREAIEVAVSINDATISQQNGGDCCESAT